MSNYEIVFLKYLSLLFSFDEALKTSLMVMFPGTSGECLRYRGLFGPRKMEVSAGDISQMLTHSGVWGYYRVVLVQLFPYVQNFYGSNLTQLRFCHFSKLLEYKSAKIGDLY